LNASVRAGEHISLPEITSIATTLGASRVCAQTWHWAERALAGEVDLRSIVVSDADAAMSCVRFANDARLLVEVSCGATLAAAYGGHLRRHFGQAYSDDEWKTRNIVLEICGGADVTLELLASYARTYGMEASIKAT
jgi:L-serine/L-threonine ammonia-lyase